MAEDFHAKDEFDALLADTEVIFGLKLPRDLIARAPHLKWIQSTSAGVDYLLTDEALIRSSVIVTRVWGIHDVVLSEFAIGLMLTFAKGFNLYRDLQSEKQWQPSGTAITLHSRTVGIVGMGDVGRAVARLARAFGMRVIAVRRSVTEATQSEYADTVLPVAELPRLLSESDYVVISCPLTRETRHMIGESELRMMKPTSCLINISRGGIVNEAALIRALEEHWIAGAGLDVFETEPLPMESRFWDLPNAVVIPHTSWWRLDYFEQATLRFCDNLRRYLREEDLLSIVDKRLGF